MAGGMRLDRALEARKLLASRARARDAILRGTVRVNGEPVFKPSHPVSAADEVLLDDPAAPYVSRAALKLVAGLAAGNVAVAGKSCLDIGASTGGFTQVLLNRGAARVYAVDVGHGQLHPSLRQDPRVVVLEKQNARDLIPALIPVPIDLLVCDVSFVSVLKVLTAPLKLCRNGAEAVVLIKPQFEVGRAHIGGRGIVTDAGAIEAANLAVREFMRAEGFMHRLSLASPIAGGDGNRETVAIFSKS